MTDILLPAFLTVGMAFLAGVSVGASERAKLRRLVRRMAERIAGQSALLARKAMKERGEEEG